MDEKTIEDKKKKRLQLLSEIEDGEGMVQIYSKMLTESKDPMNSPARQALQSRLEITIVQVAGKKYQVQTIEEELLPSSSASNIEGEESNDDRSVKKMKSATQMSIWAAFGKVGASLSVNGELVNIHEKPLFVSDKAVAKMYPCMGCTKECGNAGRNVAMLEGKIASIPISIPGYKSEIVIKYTKLALGEEANEQELIVSAEDATQARELENELVNLLEGDEEEKEKEETSSIDEEEENPLEANENKCSGSFVSGSGRVG